MLEMGRLPYQHRSRYNNILAVMFGIHLQNKRVSFLIIDEIYYITLNCVRSIYIISTFLLFIQ